MVSGAQERVVPYKLLLGYKITRPNETSTSIAIVNMSSWEKCALILERDRSCTSQWMSLTGSRRYTASAGWLVGSRAFEDVDNWCYGMYSKWSWGTPTCNMVLDLWYNSRAMRDLENDVTDTHYPPFACQVAMPPLISG